MIFHFKNLIYENILKSVHKNMWQSLYKWRRCAPPGQAHARTPTAVGKVRTEAALPAEPLGQSPAFTVALPFPFGFVGQLQRRICSMTSLLTFPT